LLLPPDSTHPLLNEHQCRHFEVLLAGLEESLTFVEDLVARNDRAEHTGLTRYASDLPPGFANSIRPVLTELRSRTTRLAAELALRGQTRSIARSIRAILVGEMVRLEDSTSAQLRGYGAVDPGVTNVIEPELNALHALLATIHRRLTETRQVASPRGDPRSGT